MYVPPLVTENDEHMLRAVMRANQFPANMAACNRTLLLYDDALTAGLGYSARLIALALLVAVQEKRVLISVPHTTARWCGRPPHTLECYYEPMTHCPIPKNITKLPKWSTRGSSFGVEGRRERSVDQLRISTSQIHRSTFWYKFHPPQALYAATHDLLYRPRAWVLDAARCIMNAAKLRNGEFAVVHARFSVEKKAERRDKLPSLAEYLPATEAFLNQSKTSRLFLQTSTPDAVDLFEQWSAERKWSLSYTQNARATHDLWMAGTKSGSSYKTHKTEYSAAGERASVVAQTVNAIIASRALHFLSPTSSMWTQFIRSLMGRHIGDKLSNGGDAGGEVYEKCLQAMRSPEGSNMSQAELKRCTRKVPQLMTIHRVPLGTEREDAAV